MGKSNSPPQIPNLPASYQQGLQVYLQGLPRQLQQEQAYRNQYDPQRIQDQQNLQDQFGPTQYQQMIDAVQQLDPAYYNNRQQLGASVSSDLAAGTSLTPDEERATEQQVRGAQAARGNTYGGAAGDAEAYALGDRGQQLYNQRVQNMGMFLGLPGMAQEAQSVPPVSPDRSSAYVNPNAGYLGTQFALQNYQNALGASQLGNNNPWGTIGGAAGGIVGGYFGGPAGASAGGTLGNYFGNYVGGGSGGFSDARLKKNIKKVGVGPRGINIYKFAFKSHFTGPIAQDVEKKMPEAVHTDPVSGYKKVDYGKVGIPMMPVRGKV